MRNILRYSVLERCAPKLISNYLRHITNTLLCDDLIKALRVDGAAAALGSAFNRKLEATRAISLREENVRLKLDLEDSNSRIKGLEAHPKTFPSNHIMSICVKHTSKPPDSTRANGILRQTLNLSTCSVNFLSTSVVRHYLAHLSSAERGS